MQGDKFLFLPFFFLFDNAENLVKLQAAAVFILLMLLAEWSFFMRFALIQCKLLFFILGSAGA